MYIFTTNKTIVLDWHDFDTCVIQNLAMINIKFNT
jgi:hypothetical protein